MTRQPTVAGLFYPNDPRVLAATVDALLDRAGRRRAPGLRALVVPHAGYEYSGPVAASAFALAPRAARVALLGPSHFVPLAGFAVSGADAWATPLGPVPVAGDIRERAVAAGALVDDAPHREHALEVELPFLQRACRDGLEILPVAVGETAPEEVASFIGALEAFVVVSTDLSHYLDHATAQRVDLETATAVVARAAPLEIREHGACGVFALRGIVEHARRADLEIELLDLRTSADTAGDPGRVVGYGAFAVRGVA